MVGCWLNPWLVYDILFFNKIALYENFYLWTLCLFMIFFSWIKLLYMKFSLLLLVLSYLPKDWRLLLSELITIWAHNLLFLLWLRSLWRFGVFGSPSIGFGFPSLCLLGRSSLWGPHNGNHSMMGLTNVMRMEMDHMKITFWCNPWLI